MCVDRTNFKFFLTIKKIFLALLLSLELRLQCTDGTLDMTFNGTGFATTRVGSTNAQANGVAVDSVGNIVAVGTDSHNFVVVRYLTNGSLDTSFNGTGIVTTTIGTSTTSSAKAVALQSDGKIVVVGTDGSNFVVARYLNNGLLDTTFNTGGSQPGVVVTAINGSAATSANGVALDVDGNIVAAGYSINLSTELKSVTLARYLPNGSLDISFGSNGIVVTQIGSDVSLLNAVMIQADGKIVGVGKAASEVPLIIF